MNDGTKKWFTIIGISIVIFACSVLCAWLFFGIPHDGNAVNGVNQGIQQLRIEQQQTTDAVEHAEKSVTDAQSTADQIERINTDSQNTTERIQRTATAKTSSMQTEQKLTEVEKSLNKLEKDKEEKDRKIKVLQYLLIGTGVYILAHK